MKFQFIDKNINPFVDEWESKKQFPAHTLFKQLGLLGIFGVNKPDGKQGFLYMYICIIVYMFI